jgi:NADH-quinone oxidoreductase chain G
MVLIKINSFHFFIDPNRSIMEACQFMGINLPRFCYHEILSVAGNCRMCLVELEKSPKPVVACTMPILNNMSIYTESPLVKKARENILELLLINHPLDCPICDQGGDCDLQDQTKLVGGDSSRFFNKKRSVENKFFGFFIKTIMNRCIHCTRCVRFSDELTDSPVFGTLNRGGNTEIGSYAQSLFNSEISGNIVDLCPVGALTFKTYAFKARPWELRTQETIDCTDGFGSNILVNFKETEIVRVQPKPNYLLNETLISDKIRFGFDGFLKNRVKQNYKKELNKFVPISLELIKQKIKDKNSLLLIVDDNSKMENLLNIFSFLNCHKNFRVLPLIGKKNNYYLNSFLFNKSFFVFKLPIKFCFIFSLNLKIENVILNTKLRIKINNQKTSIFSFGLNIKNGYKTSLINLNIVKLNMFLSGKSIFSNYFKKSKYLLIILGNCIKKKFKNIDILIFFLKKFYPFIQILNINLYSNSEGINFLGVKNLSSKLLKKQNNINFWIDLKDTYFTRKLNSIKKTNFWFNSHGSDIALKNKYIISTPTFFEQEQEYLNSDFNLQKTQTILNTKKDFDNALNILLLQKFFINKKFKFLSFLRENENENFCIFFNIIFTNYAVSTFFYNTPFKSNFEDYFLTTIMSKNSNNLLKRSQEFRNNFNPF